MATITTRGQVPKRSGVNRMELDGYIVDTLMPDLVGHDRQSAVKRLVRRGLTRIRRESITAVGEYRIERPWSRMDP